MKKTILFYILLLGILASCKKENEITISSIDNCKSPVILESVADTCFELPWTSIGTLPSRYFDFYHIVPVFNPNNPNEIIFSYRHNDLSVGWGVIKADICNEAYEFGYKYPNEPISGYIDTWSSKDWMILSDNFQLSKVKFNGDSLTQLTNDDNRYYSASWILDGSAIFCKINFPSNSPYYPDRAAILSSDGEILFIFPFSANISAYRNKKIATRAATWDWRKIGYVDTETNEFIGVLDWDDSNLKLMGIDWLDEKHIIWSEFYSGYEDAFKLKKVNIYTSEVTILKTGCENLWYAGISSSPDNNGKILVSKSQYKFVADHPDSLYFYNDAALFDTNTGEEQILQLNPF